MNETTLQFITILVTVAGLLGWLIKKVIEYFIKSANEKMVYIETLVSQNQKNVEQFTNTVNHQRTLDREMQQKHYDALRELRDEIHGASEVNGRMLNILEKRP